ncbi:hypothetical protein LAV78_14290 [Brucella intermedia]|uniref:hypothetical protein n=1 Tax=Brucella intermedia TaxID=94625 RepID=UPI0013CF3E7D|nr:hypothetical protein [Brucella intermedia]MCB4919687.1 hypothetical protein [Brucella intermedia]
MIDRFFRIATDVVTAPIAVVADVVTLGGLVNDRDEPYTLTKARRIGSNAVKVVDTFAS